MAEGVIKYQLDFKQTAPLPAAELRTLNAWRRIMYHVGMIGQDPQRYGGYAYGNISCRRRGRPAEFIISATQTGHLAELTPAHYSLVQSTRVDTNQIVACGPRPPSSEALTHAALYQQRRAIRAVIHAHCPEIWRHAASLGIPQTHANAAYGTPAMAQEIQRLFAATNLAQKRIMVMAGHTDGVVSFGASLPHSARILLETLAAALALAISFD